MVNIVTPDVRSRMMTSIRIKDTKPELLVRRRLHSKGISYRLHVRPLPGQPDLAFPNFKAVLFIHGCFWHAHDCPLFCIPSSRVDFWKAKLEKNQYLDRINPEKLTHLGWRTGIVWECALRGRGKMNMDAIATEISAWLHP